MYLNFQKIYPLLRQCKVNVWISIQYHLVCIFGVYFAYFEPFNTREISFGAIEKSNQNKYFGLENIHMGLSKMFDAGSKSRRSYFWIFFWPWEVSLMTHYKRYLIQHFMMHLQPRIQLWPVFLHYFKEIKNALGMQFRIHCFSKITS